MRISIDISPLSNASAIRGIGRYTRELIAALKKLNTSHDFSSVTNKEEKPDLIHYPFFDLFFPTLPYFKKVPTIVTIHDVIPLLFPNHYPKGVKGTISFLRQKLSLRSASHIITDSECSKRDIIDHLKVKSEKISVVHLAASQEIVRPSAAVIDRARKAYELPRNFVLYVGDINYNKNIPFLIRVMKHLPRLHLVLVSKAIRNSSIPEGRAIHHAITTLEMEKRVHLIDTVSSNQDLSSIYALANVYVQPSLYEGFGLPVLEAMQCRTPVVCSRGGSLPEVVGNAALLFHPHSEEECKAAIEKVLKMTDKQKSKLVRRGIERASEFTWERTAKETLAVYEKVLKL